MDQGRAIHLESFLVVNGFDGAGTAIQYEVEILGFATLCSLRGHGCGYFNLI